MKINTLESRCILISLCIIGFAIAVRKAAKMCLLNKLTIGNFLIMAISLGIAGLAAGIALGYRLP